MFYLGCHLSVSDGYTKMGEAALAVGANTFQYFTRNPRGGSKKIPSDEDIAGLLAILDEHRFGPVIAHAPYVYNPAAADEDKRDFALRSMAEDIETLERMPGTLYNFHPGCHVGQGSDVGVRLTAEALGKLLPLCRGTTILIETMAGKGSEIGATFEEVRDMIALVSPALREHLGVCLDTCHVSDGGYDIAADPDAVLREFDSVIGLSYLRAIHLNDSKNPVGAHKDRHEKIGQGALGLDGVRRIISHPALRDLPFCLETPCDLAGYAEEIKLLRSIRAD